MAAIALATADAAPAQSHAQDLHPLVALPLSDPAYTQLDALLRQGCRAARVSPYRPYLVADVRRALDEAKAMPLCGGQLLVSLAERFAAPPAPPADSLPTEAGFVRVGHERPGGIRVGAAATVRATVHQGREFRPLWRDVRPNGEGDPAAVGIGRVRVSWGGGDRILAVSELYGQTSGRNDPTVRGRGFRSTRAVVDFDEAYVAGRAGPAVLSVGRQAEAWLGEGRESLVLSAHGPPYDRIAAGARWKHFEGRAFFASISDVVVDDRDSVVAGTPAQRFHRLTVAHALTYRRTNWDVTLGESGVITRRGGGVDLQYLNPVMLFLVSENDSSRTGAGRDDNNLTIFAGGHLTSGRINLAGELLIDDVQIDARDRKNVPDQLGWRLTATAGLPFVRPASIGLEYSHVSTFTYLRRNYAEAYQHYDQPLGSELGPDAEWVRGSGEVFARSDVRVSARAGYWRRGARRIEQRPGESAVGHAGEGYPSVRPDAGRPLVQNAWLGDVSVELLRAALPVTVRAELAHIDNVNNRSADSATLGRIQLLATYAFRYP